MIERAIAANVPFAWVAADSVYGIGGVETALRRAVKGYALGVASNHSVHSWGNAKPVAGTAESVAQGLAPSDWKRLSAGDGTKGPRLYDWAYVELADLDASEYDASRSGLWTRGLLIRRTIADQDLAFFSTWAPAGTSIEKLVRVEGCRWAIEDSLPQSQPCICCSKCSQYWVFVRRWRDVPRNRTRRRRVCCRTSTRRLIRLLAGMDD